MQKSKSSGKLLGQRSEPGSSPSDIAGLLRDLRRDPRASPITNRNGNGSSGTGRVSFGNQADAPTPRRSSGLRPSKSHASITALLATQEDSDYSSASPKHPTPPPGHRRPGRAHVRQTLSHSPSLGKLTPSRSYDGSLDQVALGLAAEAEAPKYKLGELRIPGKGNVSSPIISTTASVTRTSSRSSISSLSHATSPTSSGAWRDLSTPAAALTSARPTARPPPHFLAGPGRGVDPSRGKAVVPSLLTAANNDTDGGLSSGSEDPDGDRINSSSSNNNNNNSNSERDGKNDSGINDSGRNDDDGDAGAKRKKKKGTVAYLAPLPPPQEADAHVKDALLTGAPHPRDVPELRSRMRKAVRNAQRLYATAVVASPASSTDMMDAVWSPVSMCASAAIARAGHASPDLASLLCEVWNLAITLTHATGFANGFKEGSQGTAGLRKRGSIGGESAGGRVDTQVMELQAIIEEQSERLSSLTEQRLPMASRALDLEERLRQSEHECESLRRQISTLQSGDVDGNNDSNNSNNSNNNNNNNGSNAGGRFSVHGHQGSTASTSRPSPATLSVMRESNDKGEEIETLRKLLFEIEDLASQFGADQSSSSSSSSSPALKAGTMRSDSSPTMAANSSVWKPLSSRDLSRLRTLPQSLRTHLEKSRVLMAESKRQVAAGEEAQAAARGVVERWKREREAHRKEVAEARAAVREKEMEAYALRRRLRRLGGMGKRSHDEDELEDEEPVVAAGDAAAKDEANPSGEQVKTTGDESGAAGGPSSVSPLPSPPTRAAAGDHSASGHAASRVLSNAAKARHSSSSSSTASSHASQVSRSTSSQGSLSVSASSFTSSANPAAEIIRKAEKGKKFTIVIPPSYPAAIVDVLPKSSPHLDFRPRPAAGTQNSSKMAHISSAEADDPAGPITTGHAMAPTAFYRSLFSLISDKVTRIDGECERLGQGRPSWSRTLALHFEPQNNSSGSNKGKNKGRNIGDGGNMGAVALAQCVSFVDTLIEQAPFHRGASDVLRLMIDDPEGSQAGQSDGFEAGVFYAHLFSALLSARHGEIYLTRDGQLLASANRVFSAIRASFTSPDVLALLDTAVMALPRTSEPPATARNVSLVDGVAARNPSNGPGDATGGTGVNRPAASMSLVDAYDALSLALAAFRDERTAIYGDILQTFRDYGGGGGGDPQNSSAGGQSGQKTPKIETEDGNELPTGFIDEDTFKTLFVTVKEDISGRRLDAMAREAAAEGKGKISALQVLDAARRNGVVSWVHVKGGGK